MVKEQPPSINWKLVVQTALVAIFLLNIALGTYVWAQRGHAIQRADELDNALYRERRALAEATAQKQGANKQARNAEEKRRDAERQKQIAKHLSYVANMNLAIRKFEARSYPLVHGLLTMYFSSAVQKYDRDFSWYLLWKNYQVEERTLSGHGSGVVSVAWSGDGKTFASGSFDKTIKIWDAASGK